MSGALLTFRSMTAWYHAYAISRRGLVRSPETTRIKCGFVPGNGVGDGDG